MKPINAIFILGRQYYLVLKGENDPVDDCKSCDLTHYCKKAKEQGYNDFHLCSFLFNDSQSHVFKEIE